MREYFYCPLCNLEAAAHQMLLPLRKGTELGSKNEPLVKGHRRTFVRKLQVGLMSDIPPLNSNTFNFIG